MSSTYLWYAPEDFPEKLIGVCDETISPDRFLFLRGQPVEPPSKPLIFDVEGNLKDLRRYDSIGNNASLPLVGPRLQMLLNAYCPNDIQYLETVIRAKDGSTQDYKAINLTHSAKIIDYAKSDCRYTVSDPNLVIDVKRIVLYPDGLGNHLMARDKELSARIFVSEKLQQAFLRNTIKGAHLQTIEKYNNFDFFGNLNEIVGYIS